LKALPKEKNQQLYLQIAEKVMKIIESRNLQPHDPVPSEAELARLFGVSRMTSKLALKLLEERGMVYRLPRRVNFPVRWSAARKRYESAGTRTTFRTANSS